MLTSYKGMKQHDKFNAYKYSQSALIMSTEFDFDECNRRRTDIVQKGRKKLEKQSN